MSLNSKKKLTWLHISDLHFKEGDNYDSEVVTRSLINSVKELCESENNCYPDIIFLTGDVAYSGKSSEYEKASAFLDSLLEKTKCTKDKLFIIPGNHDLDRNSGQFLQRTLNSEEESMIFFAPNTERPHFKKFEKFYQWYKDYFSDTRSEPTSLTCQQPEIIEINGIKTSVTLLNSAFFSLDKDDSEKLWLGRRSFDDSVKKLQQLDPDLRIALVHHPLTWLNELEQTHIEALVADNFDFLLVGHLHKAKVQEIISYNQNIYYFAAGAVYQTRQYPNKAMFVTVEISSKKVFVYPICYQDSPKERWTLDTSLFPSDTNYRCIYDLNLKKNSKY